MMHWRFLPNSLVIGLILIGLNSCDPGQTLEIENKMSTESNITFYFKGTEYYDFRDFLQEEPLSISLEPEEKKIYDFGIGTWEYDHSIDSLSSRVNKVKIETKKSTEIFEGESQILSFFTDRIVDDRYRARILIEIE